MLYKVTVHGFDHIACPRSDYDPSVHGLPLASHQDSPNYEKQSNTNIKFGRKQAYQTMLWIIGLHKSDLFADLDWIKDWD